MAQQGSDTLDAQNAILVANCVLHVMAVTGTELCGGSECLLFFAIVSELSDHQFGVIPHASPQLLHARQIFLLQIHDPVVGVAFGQELSWQQQLGDIANNRETLYPGDSADG